MNGRVENAGEDRNCRVGKEREGEEEERERERERVRERSGSSRLLRAANLLQIAASSLSIHRLFFPSHSSCVRVIYLYVIRISIFELRFSFWFLVLFLIFEDSA